MRIVYLGKWSYFTKNCWAVFVRSLPKSKGIIPVRENNEGDIIYPEKMDVEIWPSRDNDEPMDLGIPNFQPDP